MVIEMRRAEVGVDGATELLNQAGLPNLNSMEILQGGWDNTNILLTLSDASKVVLKVWNANTVEEVRRVVARHCHLDEHGIPTAVPIQLANGSLIAEKDGMAWTLLPFIFSIVDAICMKRTCKKINNNHAVDAFKKYSESSLPI